MGDAPFVLRYKQETIQINMIKRTAVYVTEIAAFFIRDKKRFSVYVDTKNVKYILKIYVVKLEK